MDDNKIYNPPYSVDRTEEFYEIVRKLQKEQGIQDNNNNNNAIKNNNNALNNNNKKNENQTPQEKTSASEFTKVASIVSRRVEMTANKLSQLTRMVKSSSMFNDSTADINRLSQNIKTDMTALKQDIDALATRLGMSGEKGSQMRQHSAHLVNNLKVQLGKQSKTFQNVLQDRAKTLKDQQERRFRMGVANKPGTALGRPMVFGEHNNNNNSNNNNNNNNSFQSSPIVNSSGLRDRRSTSPTSGISSQYGNNNDNSKTRRNSNNNNNNNNNDNAPLRLQEQQLISNYAESRAQAVDTINSTMSELGTMFSQLMEMIELQGQDIQRIDDDVSDIESNLNSGLTELQTTYNNSSNRMLMMKIFGVVMTFMIIFILFFA